MYDRVLIAVDGSDEATGAASHGLAFARAFGATAEVLHVIDKKTHRLAKTDDERAQLRDRGESILAEVEDLASTHDQSVATTLTEGTPAAAISDHAADRAADLIVVGRQGLTGLGRRLLGGVTEGLLHRSSIPVLVVPGEDDSSETDLAYSSVLLPTDGSENAEVATPHATAVAGQFDATIDVLYVVDLQAAGGVFHAGGLEDAFIERLEDDGQAAVDRMTGRIEEAAPEIAISTAVERTASFAGVADGIREYVDDHELDLVVMGSHGRSNLKRQWLGSVAATVLRSVDIPVLVVKRPS